MFGKFNKRWFILDLKSGVFYYLKSKNSKKPEKTYPITDIVMYNNNPKITDISDWKFAFSIEFTQRVYVLYAESVSVHHQWVRALGAIRTHHLRGPEQPQYPPGQQPMQNPAEMNP